MLWAIWNLCQNSVHTKLLCNGFCAYKRLVGAKCTPVLLGPSQDGGETGSDLLPCEKMEEENSNTTSQKKKEGQRKRINLMIGLVCGLALFAGVARVHDMMQ